jgi:uncharacterized phage infection (PIP) family protein YhgE
MQPRAAGGVIDRRAIAYAMAKPEPSALVAAATSFDDELQTYTRLGELLLRAPLTTLKHVERANTTLEELAQSEQRLQEHAQLLIKAIAGAREVQEQLSKRVVDHAPALKARNARLHELLATLHELAAAVAALNQQVTTNGTAAHGDVPEAVRGLSTRADALAADARASEFDELADQAHALGQRLRALATKLQQR